MKIMLIVLNLTFGADATTTHYALKHNGTEVIIPSQNPFIVDGFVGAESFSTSIMLNKLGKNHPKAAKLIGWSIIGARGFVVYHNINELRK
jgi:hypothetical protein